MKHLTKVLLIVVMSLVLGCTAPILKLTWQNEKYNDVQSQAVQQMLAVTVFIETQLESDVDANGVTKLGRRGISASGVIIDANAGIILTNNHVVDDVQRERDYFSITTNNGMVYVGDEECITLFPEYDLALINLGYSLPTPSAVITTIVPNVGETIIVVGSPFGRTNINSVSAGILSGVRRKFLGAEDIYFLQTDAAINPGNSGGPWFDSHGRMFAISARMRRHAENLGYGISMEYLLKATE